MMKEWATVISWQAGIAVLRCETQAGCHACQSRQSCGSQVLNKLGPQTEHLLHVPFTQPLVAGQKVELGIAQQSIVVSAMLVYLTPLLGLFAGAGLFQLFFERDLMALMGAIIGGGLGFLLARWGSRYLATHHQYQPQILQVGLLPDQLHIVEISPPQSGSPFQ